MPPIPVRITLGEVSLCSMNAIKDLPLLLVCHCFDPEVDDFGVLEAERKHWVGSRVREGDGRDPTRSTLCKDLCRADITILVDHSESEERLSWNRKKQLILINP
jgi:hypothetical protein